MIDVTLDKLEISAELSRLGVMCAKSVRLPRKLLAESPAHLSSTNIKHVLDIGAYSYLGPGCDIRSATIGRFCSIGKHVSIAQSEHPVDFVSTHPISFNKKSWFSSDEYFFNTATNRQPPISECSSIANDVWIGEGAFIRSGVNIGTGAIVAAHAVVVKDVPPYAIVGGCPARIIRNRFDDELISDLLATEWWRYDVSSLSHLMDKPRDFVSEFTVVDRKELHISRYQVVASGDGKYHLKSL